MQAANSIHAAAGSFERARAGLGGSVCVLCGVSETGDCFCELADGAEDGRQKMRSGDISRGERPCPLLNHQ